MTIEIEASDRVLVTGASGFIGSAVAAALVAQGASVRALGYRHRPYREGLRDAVRWLAQEGRLR